MPFPPCRPTRNRADHSLREPQPGPFVVPGVLCGGGVGAVEDAGGGADVHVEGGAGGGVAGEGGDVVGFEVPGEQGCDAEYVAEAVPGPVAVAGGVAPSGWLVGGCQDAAVEVGGPPGVAAGGGEHRPEGVGAGLRLGACGVDPGLDFLGQGVSVGGAGGVDGLAALGALGQPGEELAGDLEDLAVYVDDAAGGGDLPDGQGEFLAVAQPAVGGGVGHELVQVTAPPGGQGLAEPGDVSVGGDLGGADELVGFSLRAGPGGRAGRRPASAPPRAWGWPGTRRGFLR